MPQRQGAPSGVRTRQIPLDAPAGTFSLDVFYGPLPALAYAPSGNLLAAGTDTNTGQVLIWPGLPAASTRVTIASGDVPESLAFAPDGRTLAVGTADLRVELWQVADGTRRAMSAQHGRGVNVLAWSPDGTLIADSSHWAGADLWRAADLAPAGSLASVMRVAALAFSPDGTLLAVGTDTLMISTDDTENVVEIWDVAGQTLLYTLTGINEGITGVAWAPDGRTLALTTLQGTCQVWRPR